MSEMIFSDTRCALGEGPLWHPEEGALYWFDILGKTLFRRGGAEERRWSFDRHVSAAGWVEPGVLLIASETDLFRFDTATGTETRCVALEEDNPVTRSNDGRADPWGGFWIGTMGKNAEPEAGSIYRFHKGEVTRLFDGITVSNAISFAPGGGHAYFADTERHTVWRVALDEDGWPDGDREVFLDLTEADLYPDGAVVDAAGNLWVAQWGAARVAAYSSEGALLTEVALPATQTTCPAFGGGDFSVLHVTSAAHGAPEDDRAAGQTFVFQTGFRGQREHRVLL
ncbi:SMP-30/gluconolactonase/LRE family protein [Litorisediminicola beolgyonensis]|uniref:SMP-30/gluconolactonase/LRE family protein n=1 Tax=Litorisediminicola beolgyonensis TaxID=1173614 RepID=A0ABW3ZH89_9RHOB